MGLLSLHISSGADGRGLQARDSKSQQSGGVITVLFGIMLLGSVCVPISYIGVCVCVCVCVCVREVHYIGMCVYVYVCVCVVRFII